MAAALQAIANAQAGGGFFEPLNEEYFGEHDPAISGYLHEKRGLPHIPGGLGDRDVQVSPIDKHDLTFHHHDASHDSGSELHLKHGIYSEHGFDPHNPGSREEHGTHADVHHPVEHHEEDEGDIDYLGDYGHYQKTLVPSEHGWVDRRTEHIPAHHVDEQLSARHMSHLGDYGPYESHV